MYLDYIIVKIHQSFNESEKVTFAYKYEGVSFFFFGSSSLVARAHTFKCGEVGSPGFEPPAPRYNMQYPYQLR